MKKIFKYSLVLVIALCTSCFRRAKTGNEIENETLLSVNIVDDSVKFSDLYDKATFIPLENGEKSMLSYVSKTIVKDGKIFLLDLEPTPAIKMFTNQGEYVRNIGRMGHAKGEYCDIRDFTTNVSGDSVFILSLSNSTGNNNSVYVYDDNGKFLFNKDIDIFGVIDNIESYDGGFVCLTEYQGNDYLLHFLDHDFKIKKELISSDGKIIKEPSSVRNSIQVHGKDVWYYNWFNSTFYVIDTQNDYKMSSYKINTEKANKPETYEADDYVFSNDYDAVFCYSVVDNMIFGRFWAHQLNYRPFYWDLSGNEIKVTSWTEWDPKVDAVSPGSYYSVISQKEFNDMSKRMKMIGDFNSNYFDVYSRPITEKDNHILVELIPKPGSVDTINHITEPKK